MGEQFLYRGLVFPVHMGMALSLLPKPSASTRIPPYTWEWLLARQKHWAHPNAFPVHVGMAQLDLKADMG